MLRTWGVILHWDPWLL